MFTGGSPRALRQHRFPDSSEALRHSLDMQTTAGLSVCLSPGSPRVHSALVTTVATVEQEVHSLLVGHSGSLCGCHAHLHPSILGPRVLGRGTAGRVGHWSGAHAASWRAVSSPVGAATKLVPELSLHGRFHPSAEPAASRRGTTCDQRIRQICLQVSVCLLRTKCCLPQDGHGPVRQPATR